ncbi:MAG: methyltransferase [Terriglobales bacterium]
MSSQAPSPVFTTQVSGLDKLTELGSGYAVAASLYVVIKLDIPTLLVSGPRAVSELAAAKGVNEDALYRVMRLLATKGVFNEVGLRYFTLGTTAEALRSDIPNSLRDYALFMSGPFHLRVYAELMHSVLTGRPAVEKAIGMPVFEYFARDQEAGAMFHAAMTNFSSISVPALLDAYDFSKIGTLVDIGGGHGFVLGRILQKYPEMRGVLFDMEEVVAAAMPKLEQLGVSDRCGLVAGDFFVQIPTGGDAYIMQHIIHDWEDERAIKILRNVRQALQDKSDGKVLVIEDVISDDNESSAVKYLDLVMLTMPGGRERTEGEFRELFNAAGFRLNRIVPTSQSIKVIEGVVS